LVRVAWEDPEDPEKGFKYIYLTPEDRMALNDKANGRDVVKTELVNGEAGEKNRYKVVDVIGLADDMGVENLSAAAMIAGETSQAYRDVVTMSMATARAIGIGAYLVRLGQRLVQVENSAIILTGAAALNKLLGREVYTSNTQLGGIEIMYNNGVSHKTERNDVEGVRRLLRWLSYIPKCKGAPLPVLAVNGDPVDRDVEYEPPSGQAYDPRYLLAGDGQLCGFFDAGSFDEIMSGWARTVVAGRARLGGIPCGVIAVETRPVDLSVPADPANPDSEAKEISQAGQVWFPDSAYKTAQAMFDFNQEELPLMVFANWRGFSGGMMDMYEQVVKFGAMIVDALRQYNQPILIYIPPFAELRGGSWVVIDPLINEEQMEMYADPRSRGGVLEAEGTVSIKLRAKDQRAMMFRLDDELREISAKLKREGLEEEERRRLEEALKKREEVLAPLYHQVAVHFADLHDTPARMKEKGVIRDVVEWKSARRILYWRLRRRILEGRLVKKVRSAAGGGARMKRRQASEMIRQWFIEDKGQNQRFLWEQDRPAVDWMEAQLSAPSRSSSPESGGAGSAGAFVDNLRSLRRDDAVRRLRELIDEHPDLLHEVGKARIGACSDVMRSLFPGWHSFGATDVRRQEGGVLGRGQGRQRHGQASEGDQEKRSQCIKRFLYRDLARVWRRRTTDLWAAESDRRRKCNQAKGTTSQEKSQIFYLSTKREHLAFFSYKRRIK